ncbi:uncharacterized protein ACIB01_018000 isoform 1-T2 [Guaruba guarouba]
MAMGHKRGQPGETPANSQKTPPGFRALGRSDGLPCPARCPRWARPSGAAGTGTPGEEEVTAAPPIFYFKGSPGMRPVLQEGCGAGEKSLCCFDLRGPAAALTGNRDGEQPGQRGPSPAAPSPWTSKDGALWGATDWAFLPVEATKPG